MPKISDAFSTKVISLPSFPDSMVTIKENVSVKDIADADSQTDDISKSLQMAVKLIVGWNFVNEKDEVVPICLDSLKELPLVDVKYLIEEVILPLAQKKTDSVKT